MTPTRRTQLAVALSLIVAGGVVACESAAERQGKNVYPTLAAQVQQAASSAEGRLDLRGQALPFEWDRLIVFPAYSTTDGVSRKLGFTWRGVLKSATQTQDRYQLLVFARGHEVVAWLDFDIGKGNFHSLRDEPPIPREQAVFTVRPGDGNFPVVSLSR